MLTTTIAKLTQDFVKNPFANYVVQFVLKLQNPYTNRLISEELMGDLINLSKQKFSSNVIEKCLEHNTTEMNQGMVSCIISKKAFIFDLLIDQYGNYVIQKCLAVAAEPQMAELKNTIRLDVERMAFESEFGMKIYQRLTKKYPDLESKEVAKIKKQSSGNKKP